MHKACKHTRRTFLKSAISTVALGGCSLNSQSAMQDAVITDEMRKRKRQGDSIVALVEQRSYEGDLFAALKKQLPHLSLPDFTGKTVVIKPNMVEWRPTAVTTNAAVVLAAAQLADYLGAREVIVGEGPGHFRDMEYLLDATGIGHMCKTAGLRFIDLNYDELEKVDNTGGLTGVNEYFLPRTVVEAGGLISVPKLKTHHWVGATCSMKNLFGVVPGRKYGWPKNFLHNLGGITASIIDLQHMVKPSLALVDAIVTMEGDGPINGKAKESGFLALGDDLAAVDATCVRTMRLNPEQLPYLKIAGQTVGNINWHHINVIGSTIESLSQSYAMPVTFRNPELLKQAAQGGS